MQHRSVSAAGRRLGITASAVSHALARMRRALDDELFVLSEGGMEPTPHARELHPVIRGALAQIGEVLSTKPFDPTMTARTFRIGASDYAGAVIVPRIVACLTRAAPQVDLRVFPENRIDAERHLDEGRVALAIGWFGDVPEHMRRKTILTEREAVVVRADHPLTEAPPTLERLLAFPHVVVELIGGQEGLSNGFFADRGVQRRVWIERLVAEKGLAAGGVTPRVAVTVPHYAAVPPILERTEMVATLPLRLALRAADRGQLVVLDLPYEPLTVSVEALWHRRGDRDPGLQWLLGQIIECCEEC
jgi:DNA-binding transcriptional LysR family regulator